MSMHIDSDFIIRTLPRVQMFSLPFAHDASFNIDSRSIQKGEIFVALVGQKFDGHDFIDQAIAQGASGLVCSLDRKDMILEKYKNDVQRLSIMFVPDTLTALIDLARAWRQQFSIPVVGITGTVGKTTTKEIVRNILRVANCPAVVSSGNQNTLIGASMNILKMRDYHKVAVFELGISQQGSMRQLVDLVQPTYCVITQVGHGHMQGLGDIASIAKEKRDVFSRFTQRDIGIINGDQPELAQVSYQHPVIRFGKKTVNQIQARKIVCAGNVITFIAKIYNQRYPVVLATCNESRVMNSLAAIAVGKLLGIEDKLLIQGVEQPMMVEGRYQTIKLSSGAEIINDAYNANPESMKASLQAFDHYQTNKHKIVVLGDMLELGDKSAFWHRQVGRMLRKIQDLEYIVLIGREVAWIKKNLPFGVKSQLFENTQEAYTFLKNMTLQEQNVMLFKSSRSMKFIELIEKLRA